MLSDTNMSKRFYTLLLFAGIVVAINGCKTTQQANIDSGDMAVYRPGYPNFTMGAYTMMHPDENTGINVYLDIPYSGLIFKSNNGKHTFTSKIEITLRIIRVDPQPSQQHSKSFTKEITVNNYNETTGLKTYHFQYSVLAGPGNYRIVALVNDDQSGKYINHMVSCTIPNVNKESLAGGSIRLLGKSNKKSTSATLQKFEPEVNYNLSKSIDSLKASIQLHLKSADNNDQLTMRLFRFRTDTMPASPPNYISPTQGSLGYIGINYKKNDTVQTVDRNLHGLQGTISVDFILPRLKEGNYRVQITGQRKDSTIFYKARDFSIKSPGYPHVKTIYELADAMVYITYPKEYKRLMSYHSPDSLKQAFDALWGKLIPNKNLAKSVINTYYSRVEAANKYFSSYKEGWKTDPGMIYILYGPPDNIEQNIDGMTWYYGSMSDNVNAFYFRKITSYDGYFPYHHYILIRSMAYMQSYMNQVDDWRTGYIH